MSVETDAIEQEPARPLRRVEYEALVEAGFLTDEPVELLEGRIVFVSPEGAPHAAVISELSRLLTLAVGDQARVRTGHPFGATDMSAPEPDICVVPTGNYFGSHPQTALLVVEVSFSSIRRDRIVKQRVYAAAGVPEYWIVDLTTETVTVLRYPTGVGYANVQEYGRGHRIKPLAFPDAVISLDSFLSPPT